MAGTGNSGAGPSGAGPSGAGPSGAGRRPGLRSLRLLRELVAKGSYELALKEGRGLLELVSMGQRSGAARQRDLCVDALLELSRAYEGLGRLPAATTVMEAALDEAQLPLGEGSSGYVDGYRVAITGLAHLYHVQGQHAAAKGMWARMLPFTPRGRLSEVHLCIARCLLEIGDLGGARDSGREALQCLEQAGSGDVGDRGDLAQRVHYLNGLAQEKLGQYPEALENLDKSLVEARRLRALGPQMNALVHMSLCRYALGQEAAAAACRGEAADLMQRMK